MSKTVLCKELTYIKKDINESDDNCFPHQITNLPFHHHFKEGPIVNVGTIEERLKEMNLHMVQEKRRIIIISKI